MTHCGRGCGSSACRYSSSHHANAPPGTASPRASTVPGLRPPHPDVGKLEESAITNASVTSLRDDLLTLVNNPEAFPDVTFVVEGAPVVAHRGILVARSAHFRAMFTNGMRESRETTIVINDWSRAAFVALMEFLYTGSVKELLPGVAVDLMGLADHYGVDGLKALCESTLMQGVDAANVCSLISHAHRYQAAELKKCCMEFILKYPADVNLELLASEPSLLVEITRESIARSASHAGSRNM